MEELAHGALTAKFAVISGFGVHRMLSPEAGLHLLESEGPHNRQMRSVARVRLAATADGLAEGGGDRQAVLSSVLESAPVAAAVVRRYRLDASPLIRDVHRGWRTGRVEWVMQGQFDLLPHVRHGD